MADRPGLFGRTARRWVELVCGREVPEAMLGDLEEEYGIRRGAGQRRLEVECWYVRQAIGALRHRSDWRGSGMTGGGGMDGWTMDLRYAARGLARRWTVSLAVVLTLALGIGVNVALFTVVDAVVLEDLPYRDADELVRVWPDDLFYTSRGQTRWIAEHQTVFIEMAGWGRRPYTFETETEAEQVRGGTVEWNHFRMLGVEPHLGRTFRESDTRGTASDVLIVSFDLWQRRWGGDPSLVGRDVTVSGVPMTVVGILGAGHQPTEEDWEVWSPINLDAGHRDAHNAMAFNGRRRPGASLEQAQAEMRALFARHAAEQGGGELSEEEIASITVVPLRTFLTGGADRLLLPALLAVGFVLVIACANLSNLLLAHGRARAREMAVRRAIGAGATRITRLVLTEGLLLGLIGGTVGTLVGAGLLMAFRGSLPEILPRTRSIAMDPSVLAFAIGLTTLAILIAWAVPVARSGRARPAGALRAIQSSGVRRGFPTARLLVVGQVALTVVLVGAATLTLRSYASLLREDPGFRPESVLSFRPRFPSGTASEDQLDLHRQMLDALRRAPGVVAAGTVSIMPMHSGGAYSSLREPGGEDQETTTVSMRTVSPGYFEAMGIELVAGRFITRDDRAESEPNMVVNRTVLEELGLGERAIGRELALGRGGSPVRIVGVVDDVRQTSLAEASMPEIYLSVEQFASSRRHYAVRVEGDPIASLDRVAAAIASVDRAIALFDYGPLQQAIGRSVARPRFFTRLLGFFGLTAIALGAVGVWGVTAHSVRTARRALGVRLALGASQLDVARRVAIEGLAPVAAGTLVGLGCFWYVARLFDGFLYTVAPHDPLTFVVTPVLLFVIGVLAVLGPAVRSARLEPARILRED